MKFLWHCVILIASFGFVFLWNVSPASDYTIQALAVLVILYILITLVRRKRHKAMENFGGASDIFILNTAIFLLVFATGDIYSPLFFLLYFLGFGITFIFEPATVFIYVIGAILVLLPEALVNGSMESFLRIGSIALISPLAFFFGSSYKDRDKMEEGVEAMAERTKDSADTISKDVEEVLKDEKAELKPEDVDKLNEILEQTEELREEAKE
jgi:hypothetical protein